MAMSERETRAKKAAIRREIKNRMQRELDRRKKEIKARLRHEDISVEEKRRRYRNEAHEEKLRLMDLAKQEFRGRKRMLGLSPSDESDTEPPRPPSLHEPLPEPPVTPLDVEEDDVIFPDEHEDQETFQRGISPEAAFVYTDGDEDEVLEQYESPIAEHDALPSYAEPRFAEPRAEEEFLEEGFEAQSLIHYITNLTLHPIQTLDEFDDYLAAPSGLGKVFLFYLISLLPVALVAFFADEIVTHLPTGLLGSAIGSAMSTQSNPAVYVGRAVLDLLIYSASIAVVNYFVTDEGNFVTLTTYFAFVEGVARIVIYTLVIGLAFAAVLAPPLLAAVALLFLAFLIWRIVLNIIVLMSAYGYEWWSASFLSIGASFVRAIVVGIVMAQLGNVGF